jgi:hypothetical protein
MNSSPHPISSALTGTSLVVPLFALNAIVGNRIEPFFSLIRPASNTSALEYLLLAVVLLCLPIGAFVAVRPILAGRREGRRWTYPMNGRLDPRRLSLALYRSRGRHLPM